MPVFYAGDTWGVWAAGTASATLTTSTVMSSNAWLHWQDNTTTLTTGYSSPVTYQAAPPPAPSPEEVARRQAAALQAAEAQQRADAERAAAAERGWALLDRELSPEQRAMFRMLRYFEVLVGARGPRRRYRICEGVTGNVELLGPDGSPTHRYCIHPRESVPVGDVLLAQLLLLRTDEAEFRRIAHVTTLPRRVA